MEHYDDSFENSDALPTVKEIEQRLRTLGCTKEQISRHLHQVAKSRIQPADQKPIKHRDHQFDWPSWRRRLRCPARRSSLVASSVFRDTNFPRTTG